uniref:Putative ornithine decarboxylase n=1 Tax=Corethrella appendiculata TaxID=1370023 RepID=U5ET48_9DIPT
MKFLTQDERIEIVDGQVNIRSIMDQHIASNQANDEPFYIFNVGDMVRKHQNWIEKMPRVQPFYAVKCNDNDIGLATLAALGAGFDCASKGELSKVLSLGVNPERIIFANPAKPNSHIHYAANFNVKTMTFDSEIELKKIKMFCPDAKLVLRIICEAKVAQCPLGKKFGCDPVTEAPRLIKAARKMNLDIIGISFHVGSGCADYPIYGKAIEIAKNLFDFGEKMGYKFNLLDVGGGFPGDIGTSIDEVAFYINQALDLHFPDKSVKVIGEPGRYYVSSAYTLVAKVHSKRILYKQPDNTANHIMYFINDGVYGSFNCILYDHQIIHPKLFNENYKTDKTIKQFKSTIFGPTCDALDTICEIMLPELEIDDYMYFENMGAYTIPVASPFNGFPLPKIFPYISLDLWEMLKNLFPLSDAIRMKKPIISNTYENIVCA